MGELDSAFSSETKEARRDGESGPGESGADLCLPPVPMLKSLCSVLLRYRAFTEGLRCSEVTRACALMHCGWWRGRKGT